MQIVKINIHHKSFQNFLQKDERLHLVHMRNIGAITKSILIAHDVQSSSTSPLKVTKSVTWDGVV